MLDNLGSEGRRFITRAARFGRKHVGTARLYVERTALAALPDRPARRGGRILCYHSLGQPIFGVNDVGPRRFRRHIELALQQGYRFVPAAEIARDGGQDRTLAITFDDGLRSVGDVGAAILAEYRIPWSMFVVSSWVDRPGPWEDRNYLRWADLEKLARAGVELGSHSVNHPDFAQLERPRMVEELAGSREAIGRRLGIEVNSFAIPWGQSTNWSAVAAEAAREAGYQVVYSQAEGTRFPGTIPRTFVTRFDNDRIFRALLGCAFDNWEEWY